jgi:hypothetical protein
MNLEFLRFAGGADSWKLLRGDFLGFWLIDRKIFFLVTRTGGFSSFVD